MQDDGRRDRRRRGGAVGGHRRPSGSLEDAERRGRCRDHLHQVRDDEGQDRRPRRRRGAQAAQHRVVRGGEDDPRRDRPGGHPRRHARVAQRPGPLAKLCRGRPRERAAPEPDPPCRGRQPPADAGASGRTQQQARQDDERGARPLGRAGRPARAEQRRRGQHEGGERGDVEHPLDQHARGAAGGRHARLPAQRDDTGGLAGARGQQVVEEVADVERPEHGPPRGPPAAGEECAPALGPHPHRHRKQQEGGGEPARPDLAERDADGVPGDAADRKPAEPDRDREPGDGVRPARDAPPQHPLQRHVPSFPSPVQTRAAAG
jgi:hypothetical protein